MMASPAVGGKLVWRSKLWILPLIAVFCPPFIQCQFEKEGDVRLVEGPTQNQGRVEIFHDGLWGTVCDDSWDVYDARVVCRQLGYSNNIGGAWAGGKYPRGSGPIHLDDVACEGNETRLDLCKSNGWDIQNCGHSEDAGVICQDGTEGDIRLADGPTPNQGRVEIFHDGLWGTVCDVSWDVYDARVVCRQLGYSNNIGGALEGSKYPEGSGPIHLNYVDCEGNETRLDLCQSDGWDDNFCGHESDAGVICQDGTEGDIRLADGPTPNQGRVEIFHDGLWGTVCDVSWDVYDARVVCRQLGYSNNIGGALEGSKYPEGSGPIHLNYVDCEGNETRLDLCQSDGWDDNFCGHESDAGVICQDGTEGDIRLADGPTPNQGRVEIFHDGLWGTVCDERWDVYDARVVCRQLGYSNNIGGALNGGKYPSGSGPIHLDFVDCEGNETRLDLCQNDGWDNNFCGHESDAGVTCQDGTEGDIRLVDGPTPNQGRVEIFHDGLWGTVCDDIWDVYDARVVCRQLGYSNNIGGALNGGKYPSGSGPIHLDYVDCEGNETRLDLCQIDGWDNNFCGHESDAGVICQDGAEGDIRLVDGPSPNQGRVEIFHDGLWGTVCDDIWDVYDARVVCRQLGYSNNIGGALNGGKYPSGSGPIHLDFVDCEGNETRLDSCQRGDWDNHFCGHESDAGVICQDGTKGDIRLADGPTPSEGRVEIFHDGLWGTVCDHSWDVYDARVVCRQLGYSNNIGGALDGGKYPKGSGPIHLDYVDCEGNETRLDLCQRGGWDNNFCGHESDAGVICQDGTEGDVRLVDGPTPNEGRVEIFHDGLWGTVCDDSWDVNDARVVCRQLGYSGDVLARSYAHYGQGSGPIYLDDVDCTGSESSLMYCSNRGWGIHNCVHSEDAGVFCDFIGEKEGDIRLVDGFSPYDGRIEIFHNGLWGTVCDDAWDDYDARVVCRQLGYSGDVGVARHGGVYSRGLDPIYLDDVGCEGDELRLDACFNNGWGNNNCGHSEDAGVYCGNDVGNEGDIRLVNGSTANQGRVEIFHEGQWGTVCDDYWDDPDARVVCRQLGYLGDVNARVLGVYGVGSGPILLDNVNCDGNEDRLDLCNSNGWYNHDCGHSEDAGVYCDAGDGLNGEVRLVDGSTPNEGRVEIYHDGQWGTICFDSWHGWDDRDARVVCRQLGFSGDVGEARSPITYGHGSGPIYLEGVRCQGYEARLDLCVNDGWYNDNCGHSQDAGVYCPTDGASEGDVRIVNGYSLDQGRVEIYHNGQWGTVCDDNWDDDDARVVCRQLGFLSNVGKANDLARYGQGTGPIYLDDVFCEGNEARLDACVSNGWGINNCGHSEDAGVYCGSDVGKEGEIRLVNGSTPNDGRVEIFHDDQWGTVCDDSWDDADARVVCRQLGYVGDVGEARSPIIYGQGSGPIYLDDVGCEGDEARLDLCVSNGWYNSNCGHSEDAGVYCTVDGANDGNIRLVNGPTMNEGRVEIYYNGQWGTVCDDSWDDSDARVVCRQLGYSGDAVASSRATYGEGAGPIYLDDVLCGGGEARLDECDNNGWGINNCRHSEDAGVSCTIDDGMNGEVRLVDGSTPNEGRVEIYYNGQWGTVCDDDWDDTDARVVCRQLGFSGHYGKAVGLARYGQGTGPIYLDDVLCGGSEARLDECDNNGWGIHNCGHSEDAGVHCGHEVGNEGEIRLVNGSTPNEGRVEIFHDTQWGTVCDDDWDDNDARVVCRQLGFLGGVGQANGLARYGQGTGPIYLDDVLCEGNEARLDECGSNGWYISNCGHSEDAGVYCPTDVANEPGDIRLVNGPTMNEGRVEIYFNDQWGTVCDDRWDDLDARVVCRQLGYSVDAVASSGATYGQGTGPIYFNKVNCAGNEARLDACDVNALGVDDYCGHSEDAGVYCHVIRDEDIRLVNGSTPNQGRVEIFYKGVWGTVCDDEWDDTDASVVCRQLGYASGLALGGGKYLRGSGPIYLDDVVCEGSEDRLSLCISNGWGNHNCRHSEDAGVYCYDENEGDVRIMDGDIPDEGRVEIYHNGQWGTVCDDSWDDLDARVVCRQLGYSGDVGEARIESPYGEGHGPIHVDYVSCSGSESRLVTCNNGGWGNNNCRHYEDAGVYCGIDVGNDGDIRLRNGSTANQGRVDIYYNGQWGTVCDDEWDDADAIVVCRQLGYISGTAWSGGKYPHGSGPIYLDDVACEGNEDRLTLCISNGWLNHNCGHSGDAGVYCNIGDGKEGEIRLADGPTPNQGRIEIFHGGEWGTICDDSWTVNNARVVCRQLGYQGDVGTSVLGGTYGPGSGPILDVDSCEGSESKLIDCSIEGWISQNCGHSRDAGVSCETISANDGDIRLVNGSTENEGRVEIFHNGLWGTICDDGWDDADARVVCRQLGYMGDVGGARGRSTYGQGSDPIYLDDVGCYGSESRLTDCSNDGWGSHNCGHSEDAGVYCYVPSTTDPGVHASTKPRYATSASVVGVLASVGVCLFLLTLLAIGAVCWTCRKSKSQFSFITLVHDSPLEQDSEIALDRLSDQQPAENSIWFNCNLP
ncbi:deleted in malignant brain tumors 1 protein-like isoform X2 [Lytechinus variegatus]|uniref:deleted in malignant brain tumors 1 protein-like isoform X2 n=1 Tax=Lytechinus variegatus TaxID=7654 RepID=UPI001BB1BD11|nr:deleted in malignant brain tumors 1 protein-like isoform X2 [Lytechinus variegatus]